MTDDDTSSSSVRPAPRKNRAQRRAAEAKQRRAIKRARNQPTPKPADRTGVALARWIAGPELEDDMRRTATHALEHHLETTPHTPVSTVCAYSTEALNMLDRTARHFRIIGGPAAKSRIRRTSGGVVIATTRILGQPKGNP